MARKKRTASDGKEEWQNEWREVFGCEPFTDEGFNLLKSALFSNSGKGTQSDSVWSRYLEADMRVTHRMFDEQYGTYEEHREKEMIKELEEKGYKISK